MKNKKIIIGIAVFLIIAGFSGWFIYRDFTSSRTDLEKSEQEEITEIKSLYRSQSMDSEEIKQKMPDLDREIIVRDNTLPEETKKRAITEIKMITAELKNDYNKREEWLNLGIWRKTIGDFEGAREAWEFVTLIRPQDAVAFHNLGDLYSLHLIDFSKAEKYYLEAIKLASDQAFFYVKLHEFYRYFVKKPDLAEDILEKGIKATSGNSYLKNLLEDYRKEI